MARYKATARGFAGRLIEEGEEFDFDGPKGSWMQELEKAGEDEDGEDGEGEGGTLTRDQVKAALDAMGVQYNVRAGTEALQKLLDVELEKAAQ